MLRKGGERDVLQAYDYCSACLRLLSSKETAIPLLRGLAETHAKMNGVSNHTAESIAKKYADFLEKKS